MLITFEGGEASGKSTQVRRLRGRLRRRGYAVTLVAEPGGTPLGLRLRRVVKASSIPLAPETEAMLFLASRAHLVRQVLQPALERGDVVVCDRFGDSTLAYQGYGRGLDLDVLRTLNAMATASLSPDLTVLLDLPVGEGRGRRAPDPRDRFDAEDAGGFHERVRRGYLALAREEPGRWLVLDGAQVPAQVANVVWRRVRAMLAAADEGSIRGRSWTDRGAHGSPDGRLPESRGESDKE